MIMVMMMIRWGGNSWDGCNEGEMAKWMGEVKNKHDNDKVQYKWYKQPTIKLIWFGILSSVQMEYIIFGGFKKVKKSKKLKWEQNNKIHKSRNCENQV